MTEVLRTFEVLLGNSINLKNRLLDNIFTDVRKKFMQRSDFTIRASSFYTSLLCAVTIATSYRPDSLSNPITQTSCVVL